MNALVDGKETLVTVMNQFLPRDVMLARYMLWPCVSMSVFY